jgi:hypothetical protein
MDMLVYSIPFEVCSYIYKKDMNKLIAGIQNEILLENEIITGVKNALGRMGRSMLCRETAIILNDMVKNGRYPQDASYRLCLKRTYGYELPLLVSFLAAASTSGDRSAIRRNLGGLEKYCRRTFENCKDRISAKMPYTVIIMMLPLFLFWMDSFNAGIVSAGSAAVQEPKEYIYIFSSFLAYILLIF